VGVPTPALPAKSFPSALADVMRGPEFISTHTSIQAIELDFASREIVLQPMLEVGVKRTNDNRELLNTSATRKSRTDVLDVTLTKPFATGTKLEFGPSWENATIPSLIPNHRDTVEIFSVSRNSRRLC
jgi:hypothetical protein